jgi:N-acetylmuramoyl-L-alanine amidase
MTRRAICAAALVLAVAPALVGAQSRSELKVHAPGIAELLIGLSDDRGFSALAVTEVRRIGWQLEEGPEGTTLRGPGGATIRLQAGTPYFTWGEQVLQLYDAPYMDHGRLWVPLQLLTDFLPRRLPRVYSFDTSTGTLRVAPPGVGRALTEADMSPRVVVIDAGHGGSDPGAIGPGNVREKNVALGIAKALAEHLDSVAGLEVHLLRDDDTFIPLWDRGPAATQLKGDRVGIFVSIHANSMPNRRDARGFETYFLSDARTDDERRVAAIENAPLRLEAGPAPDDQLDAILRELANLDHTHWSSLLAVMVQEELAGFHPGPDRGVKQAPLAVLTNVPMPGVLVEIGFVSNPDEAPLLGTEDFQNGAAEAITRGIRHFFERYPPGNGTGGGGGREGS